MGRRESIHTESACALCCGDADLVFRGNRLALNQARVRYLVVGGLAVDAHGYVRLTHDVDMVVKLDRENILPAFAALG